MPETVEELKKECAMCGEEKPYSEYHKKTTKTGRVSVQSKCKPCSSKYKKERYWSNHEVELAKMTKSRLKPENVIQRKGYYEKNKGEYRKRHDKYMADTEKRQQRNEKSKQKYLADREKIRERHKRNYQKLEVKERIRERHKIRKESDVNYLIKRRLRFRLRNIVKSLGNNKYKQISSLELLGCEMDFFKAYLEEKFTEGMCWERLSEIHIDHIKPCSKFDLTKIEEQKICFHYTNLQPLWEEDNLKKNSKYPFKIAS